VVGIFCLMGIDCALRGEEVGFFALGVGSWSSRFGICFDMPDVSDSMIVERSPYGGLGDAKGTTGVSILEHKLKLSHPRSHENDLEDSPMILAPLFPTSEKLR
jgi:hypothetical protein